MKKITFMLLFFTIIVISCNKKKTLPDITGQWVMDIAPADVPINSTQTTKHYFREYVVKLTKTNDLQYHYSLDNVTWSLTSFGQATYDQGTKEFQFDTFYEDNIYPDVKGYFTGKLDEENEKLITGDLFLPVWVSLGVGNSKEVFIKTNYTLNKF